MGFLKRLGRAIADILTSKKAIATIRGVIAHQLGADPATVIAITGYVIGQGFRHDGRSSQQPNLPPHAGHIGREAVDVAGIHAQVATALAVVAKKYFLCTSESDGDWDGTWTDTGTEQVSVAVRLPNGRVIPSTAFANT